MVRVLNSEEGLSVAMAALFLRGAPRTFPVATGRWPAVLRALREQPGEPSRALRGAGLWSEATLVESAGLVEWAAEQVRRRECLTVADPGYPGHWLAVLRHRAPAAVWIRGREEALEGSRWVSIVGSRSVPPDVGRFAREVALEAVRLGFGVVSGGAEGCDAAAASAAYLAAGNVAEVLPFGLTLGCSRPHGIRISVCAPDEPFSRGAAMERNALIYAFSPVTVVCHARFRSGGTWHGAVDALRRRLTRLVVRDDGSPAARALVALGAAPIQNPDELGAALVETELPRGLFLFG